MNQSNEKTTGSSMTNDTDQVSPLSGNTPVVAAGPDAFPPTSIPIPSDPDAAANS
jgi:hypothetical protein